jgi:hypothetical protein
MKTRKKIVILLCVVHCVGFVTFSQKIKGLIATKTNFGHFFCTER